jgi:hypothetical protein
MRKAGNVECTRAMRNEYKRLIKKLEAKRPCGKYIRRWEDNIKIDLKATWSKGMDRIKLGKDKAHSNKHMGCMKYGTFNDQLSNYRILERTTLHQIRQLLDVP